MWISIEQELPKMKAKDLLNGGTEVKVKHPKKGILYSKVCDHETWYFDMKEEGVTHWFKEGMTSIERFFTILQENGTISYLENVPVGITVSDSGKLMVRYSLSQNVKTFTDHSKLIEFIINEYQTRKDVGQSLDNNIGSL